MIFRQNLFDKNLPNLIQSKGLLGVSSLDQKAAMKPWTFWPKTFGADLDNQFETGPWWKRPRVRPRVDKRMKVDGPGSKHKSGGLRSLKTVYFFLF